MPVAPTCAASPANGRCFCSPTTGSVACIPRGTHLVLLGDSTTRYQYLMLAAALVDGIEYTRTNGTDLIYNEHTFCGEASCSPRALASWTRFYNLTNAWLNRRSTAAEFCDCYRHDSYWHWGRRMEKIVENRYFSTRDVNVSYVQVYGRNPLHGWWWPGDPDSKRAHRRVYRNCTGCWSYPLHTAIEKLLPDLGATHAVLSVGGGHIGTQPLTELEFESWRRAFDASKVVRAVWKSYTTRRHPEYSELASRYFDVFDAFGFAHNRSRALPRGRSVYVDDRGHVDAAMNNILNVELIRHLFGPAAVRAASDDA